MKESYVKQLHELAATLVTPERFGKVAMAPVVQLVPRPEIPPQVA